MVVGPGPWPDVFDDLPADHDIAIHVTFLSGKTITLDVKANDTVLVNLETGKIENKCKFEVGAMCMIKGGNNMGRVGVITTREKHPGSSSRLASNWFSISR